MKRAFLLGLGVTVIGALGLFIAALIGMSLQNTVMGVGAGATVAIVRIGHPIWRLVGFLIGFAAGVLFDAMRLGLLPGGWSVVGGAVMLAIVLLLVTIVSGVSSGRISLWSMVLGALTFIAGFSPVIDAAPWTAGAELPGQVFSLLAMAAIGFLCVLPAELLPDAGAQASGSPEPRDASPASSAGSTDAATPLSEMIGGVK